MSCSTDRARLWRANKADNVARTAIPDAWMKQAYNPDYDWVFRTKNQSRIQNGITTPTGQPDPSFYWSRFVLSALALALAYQR